MPSLTIRLTDAEHARVRAAAEASDMTTSDYVRHGLRVQDDLEARVTEIETCLARDHRVFVDRILAALDKRETYHRETGEHIATNPNTNAAGSAGRNAAWHFEEAAKIRRERDQFLRDIADGWTPSDLVTDRQEFVDAIEQQNSQAIQQANANQIGTGALIQP